MFGGNHIMILQAQSEDVMNVFNKTVESYKEINAEIQEHVKEREEALAKLIKEKEDLLAMHVKNSTVVEKIESFFK